MPTPAGMFGQPPEEFIQREQPKLTPEMLKNAGQVAGMLNSALTPMGDYEAWQDAQKAASKGNYGEAAFHTATMIPAAGDALKYLSPAMLGLLKKINPSYTTTKQSKQALDKISPEKVETFKDTTAMAKQAHDELLDFVGYEADYTEIIDAIDDMSPATRNLLRALERDEFLGFDDPAQALRQLIKNPEETLLNYDISPQLKGALTKYANNPPTKEAINLNRTGFESTIK